MKAESNYHQFILINRKYRLWLSTGRLRSTNAQVIFSTTCERKGDTLLVKQFSSSTLKIYCSTHIDLYLRPLKINFSVKQMKLHMVSINQLLQLNPSSSQKASPSRYETQTGICLQAKVWRVMKGVHLLENVHGKSTVSPKILLRSSWRQIRNSGGSRCGSCNISKN